MFEVATQFTPFYNLSWLNCFFLCDSFYVPMCLCGKIVKWLNCDALCENTKI